MKYLSLTFKNIRKFILLHPVMFFMFIAVQVICCVAVYLTCGMAYNMFYTKEKASEYMQYTVSFEKNMEDMENLGTAIQDENGLSCWVPMKEYTDDEGEIYYLPDESADPSQRIYEIEREGVVPMTVMKEKLPVLIEELGQYSIAKISLLVFPNKMMTPDNEGEYYLTLYPDKRMINKTDLDSIYIFSDEKLIIDSDKCSTDRTGTIRQMNGYDYKYVSLHKGVPFIPYNALDDEFAVYLMYVSFEDRLTQSDLDKLTPIFNSAFGEYMRESFPPEPYDPIEMQFDQMVYVISVVVMIIILLAIAKFYSFVLSDRKKLLTVLRLCGCSRVKVHLIYMLEIFMMMAVTSVSGLLLFRYCFFKGIAEMYPSFRELYSDHVYLIVLFAYIMLALLIMAFTVIPSTKACIADMKRNT